MALMAVTCLAIAMVAGCDQGQGNGADAQPLDAEPPMFTLPDLADNQVSLEEVLQEKPVLLVFWATWCPPCVAEIPHLNKINVEHGNDLAVIAVNLREDREQVSAFAARRNIGYTVLLDSDGEVARKYAVNAVPTLIVIGRDGKAFYRGHSSSEAERVLGRVIEH